MGREWGLVLSHIPIACSVFLENQVGVGSNILVRVNGSKGGGSNTRVDGVSHKVLWGLGKYWFGWRRISLPIWQ